jgi:addiction module RelE/StbE family toxin
LRLFWTELARADRRAIYEYIEADNPRAALTLDELFDEKTGQLLTYQKIGRPGRLRGTRELVVAGTSYVVVYRIELTVVVILRVLHGAQQWPLPAP